MLKVVVIQLRHLGSFEDYNFTDDIFKVIIHTIAILILAQLTNVMARFHGNKLSPYWDPSFVHTPV